MHVLSVLANRSILVLVCIFSVVLQQRPCVALIRSNELAQNSRPAIVTVRTSRHINRFDPSHALGAAVDAKEKGMTDRQLTPQNIETMRSAGLQSLIYRLKTELANEVWHWNPQGSWSHPVQKQG